MPVRWAVVRRVAFQWFEALTAVPVLVALWWFDLAGPLPLWVVFVLVMAIEALMQPGVQRWLAGGDLRRRPALRLALHLLPLAILSYALGWGPVLGVGPVLIALAHMELSGTVIWRRAVVLSLLTMAAGQAAIAAGWVYSYLPAAYAQAIGLLGALTTAFTIRLLGLAGERREQAEAAVRRSEERFRELVQDSHDVVAVCDPDGQITYVSPAAYHVTGFRAEEMVGTRYDAWLPPDDVAAADDLLARSLSDPDRQHTAELRLRRPDGGSRWVEVTIRNLLGNPAVEGLVAVYRDITERRTIQDRLAYDASHDALTGLVNRAEFLRELALATAGGGRGTAVLFVDLDGLKQVNDTLGHEAGDALIAAAAAMQHRGVLGADVVGRLGGDEFGVLLSGIGQPEHAVAVARRIHTEMDHPVTIAGQQVLVRASIGVATGPGAGADLLHRADVAMYAAKRHGTHGIQVYVEGLADPARPTATLEEDLRRALRGDQLRLHYQPLVSLDSGEITGLEALVRWAHPVRGLLGPQAFIPLAEQTGIIDELGQWVLDQACSQVRGWQRRTPAGRRLALCVNISPRQLDRADLAGQVAAILDRTGFDPTDLTLEVTEDALIDESTALPGLHELSALGIRIALDDFGTGYSSLRYLTQLPVNTLKIDRCFIAELNGTHTRSAVVEAVLRLAHALDLDTVAEGIETADQAAELTLLGCRTGQGFHFARPLPPDDLDAILDRAAPGWPVLPADRLTAGPTTHPRPAVAAIEPA